jgi:hypothetical protein
VITTAVIGFNIVLGLVYMQYGTMTLLEMIKSRRTMGFSHFGAAWIAMAFTCGPHHWFHGIHLLEWGGKGGPLDLIAVLVGFPAGVIWFGLRVEAYRGGRGDRHVAGTPHWIMALPTLAGVYVTALVAAVIAANGAFVSPDLAVFANLLLVVLYSAIGYYLTRTQLANRRPLGGWSLSGLALAVIFPTCALMHGIYAFYLLNGSYPMDQHMLAIDLLAVPAAAYFLWVVHALYRGTFRDWNGAPTTTKNSVGQPSGPSDGGPGGGRRAPLPQPVESAPAYSVDASTTPYG